MPGSVSKSGALPRAGDASTEADGGTRPTAKLGVHSVGARSVKDDRSVPVVVLLPRHRIFYSNNFVRFVLLEYIRIIS